MNKVGKQILKATPLQWIKFIIVTTLYILFTVWDDNYWLLVGLLLIFDIYILRIIPWNIWKQSNNNILRKIMEWIDAIVFALIVVYFIHIFIFQHYEIPTSSLEKTLLVGDYLFVSKINYGPRIPNTPLAFPITHNTLPIINTKSYFNYPYWSYKRLKSLSKIKRGDIVVFNFPAGDTVASNYQVYNYYDLVNQFGWEHVSKEKSTFGKIISRPVDRRENFVKRCIGMPGDSLQIIDNIVYINGKTLPTPQYAQFNYFVETKGELLSEKQFRKLEINKEDQFLCNKSVNASFIFNFLGINPDKNNNFNPVYHIPLTKKSLIFLKKSGWIKSICIEPENFGDNTYSYIVTNLWKPQKQNGFSSKGKGGQLEYQKDNYSYSRFTREDLIRNQKIIKQTIKNYDIQAHKRSTLSDMDWTRDNFGPIWIPKKGATIVLNEKNLGLYKRCIVNYEGNTLRQDNNHKIFLNKKVTNTYTFNYDYYFMMGDNRHNSLDSRIWGFVPEDHIVGKPLLVLMSIDKDRNWWNGKIRWNRILHPIKD